MGEPLFDPGEGAGWVQGRRVHVSQRLAALLERLVHSAPRSACSRRD